MLATYSGDFKRPSILSDETPARTSSGRTSSPEKSCGLNKSRLSPSETCLPSEIKSYGIRQACAHSPRFAERPPSDSLVKHWPEYATHNAPWTKTSRGKLVGRASSRAALSIGETARKDARPTEFIFSISLMLHSRARTARLQPRSRANSIPAALEIVICVQAWIGKSRSEQ